MKIYTIYKITNTINNKVYIGYTYKDAMSRFKEHISTAKRNPNTHIKIQRAILKYGENSFKVEPIYVSKVKSHILQMEDYFINEYNTLSDLFGYNMCKGGQGGDIRSESQKEQLSILMTHNNPSKRKDVKVKISEAMKDAWSRGCFNTESFKNAKIRNKERLELDNIRQYWTEDSRSKMKESMRKYHENNPDILSGENNPMYGRKGEKSPKFIGYWITPAGVFTSLRDAAKALSIDPKTVRSRCLSEKEKFKEWEFEPKKS